MDIRGFKLSTGEVIIAQFISRNDGRINVDDAAQMVIQELEPGRSGVALQDYIPFGKSVQLYESNIVAEFDLDPQVAGEYNRIFGSGIVVASADTLLNLPR
ncbi:MAG: hypothetical protein ACMV1B_10965 [Prevotella sp.]|jgi:hypothetical protein